MTTGELLARLEGVRKSGAGWMAKCPAHEDKTASLAIGKGDDGRILLNCFAECSVYSITQSLGLELSDLFPPKQRIGKGPIKLTLHPGDLLRILDFESKVVLAAAQTLADGNLLTSDDYRRLVLAEERISAVRRYA